MFPAVWLGFGFGALTAANIGPIWLLCFRTAARYSWRAGALIGAGAALVDGLYALVGVSGATAVVSFAGAHTAFGLLGASVVIVLGARTVRSGWRMRNGLERESEVVGPSRAFATGVIATASNPVTIVTWAAVFSGVAATSLTAGPSAAIAFIAGVCIGSMTVHLVVAVGAARIGRRLSTGALVAIDAVAGTVMVGLGLLLGARSMVEFRESL